MKRSTKIWYKQCIAWVLIVLMSIESFAAVVGDNDGAAFITKAEFESMKSNFNNTIDRYNRSLDSKMQGAIQSYLAGVKIPMNPTNLYARINGALGRSPVFTNYNPTSTSLAGTGTQYPVSQLNIAAEKNYSNKYTYSDSSKIITIRFNGTVSAKEFPSSTYALYFTFKTNINSTYTTLNTTYATITMFKPYNNSGTPLWAPAWAELRFRVKEDLSSVTLWRFQQYAQFTSKEAALASYERLDIPITNGIAMVEWDDTMTGSKEQCFMFFNGGLETNQNKDADANANTIDWTNSTSDSFLEYIGASFCGVLNGESTYNNFINKWTQYGPKICRGTLATHNVTSANRVSSNFTRPGSGSLWHYELLPTGNKQLFNYWTSCYIAASYDLAYKTYKEFPTTYDSPSISTNTFNEPSANTYTPSLGVAQTQTTGTKYSTYTTNNNVGYCKQDLATITVPATNLMKDVRTYQWSSNTATKIYATTNSPVYEKRTTVVPHSYTDLPSQLFELGGSKHSTSKVTNTIYEVTIKPEQRDSGGCALNEFENPYYTGIAGESVMLGYGIPIFIANDDAEADHKVSMKIKKEYGSGTNVTARLSRNHFVNGNFQNASDKIDERTITFSNANVGQEKTAEFEVTGLPQNTLVWLNLDGATADNFIALTDFSVKLK